MIEFHVLPHHNRWQVRRDGNRIAVYDLRDDALHHTVGLAQAADEFSPATHAHVVLKNADGQQHRMTIPRSSPDLIHTPDRTRNGVAR